MWRRLIDCPPVTSERIPLITAIFSDDNEIEVVRGLCKDDAQAFIDIVDETLGLPDLAPRLQWLNALWRICGSHTLLPRSLHISHCYHQSESPRYYGGFADVWMGDYQGRPAAVKVLRVYTTSDMEKIAGRFCKEVITWKTLRHPNVLPLLGAVMNDSHFAMVSEWMVNGNINQFVQKHKDVNRFEPLQDVARGLMYIHNQSMIHGDLKGANILIDREGRARIADFGLLTTTICSATSSSSAGAGTRRWMSPELLDPALFGSENRGPTKGSDCYALGMVIFEVVSGEVPFSMYGDGLVLLKVIEGECPGRPQGPEGVWFTDELWEMLKLCWSPQPKNRPTIGVVLEHLKRASTTWQPLPPRADVDVATVAGGESYSTATRPFFVTDQVIQELVHHLATDIIPQDVIPELLSTIFGARCYRDSMKDLPEPVVRLWVERLDQIIDSTIYTEELRRRALRSLRKTCGSRRVLPRSHHFPGRLFKTGPRPLAGGGTADVWRVADDQQNLYAAKVFRVNHGEDHKIKRYYKEVTLWKRLDHPNVVPTLGVGVDIPELCLVSPWMSGGHLLQYISKYPGVSRTSIMLGIVDGLFYLHFNDVVHGGLKGENILFDGAGIPRIADFGISSITFDPNSYNASTPFGGYSLRWAAPEILEAPLNSEFRRSTKMSDVYAFGMVVVEIFTGRYPFPDDADLNVQLMVMKGKRPSKPADASKLGLSSSAWKLIKSCWDKKRDKRPEIQHVASRLREPW